jgi:ABC-type multidrug transport system permease subunit
VNIEHTNLVLGNELSSLAKGSMAVGVNFKTFIHPVVLAMSVLFTAIFSAASIVWDREFGFLGAMLVAPVSRPSIVVGKCLGGTTIAALQDVIMLALAGLADVPYKPVLMLTLAGEILLAAHSVRRNHGGPDHPVPGVHGADSDARDAAVLPVRRAVPAARAAPSGSVRSP